MKLFEEPEKWQGHWQGMPEFKQEKQKSYAQIIFRFESEEDLQDFAKVIGQKLTKKTKSCWHPFKSHWGNEKKVWEDDICSCKNSMTSHLDSNNNFICSDCEKPYKNES